MRKGPTRRRRGGAGRSEANAHTAQARKAERPLRSTRTSRPGACAGCFWAVLLAFGGIGAARASHEPACHQVTLRCRDMAAPEVGEQGKGR